MCCSLLCYKGFLQYGDYEKDIHRPGFLKNEHLLPQRVLDQYQMTPDMWEERITSWYGEHKGLTRDEAEVEYLKLAQDLEMYGVRYFEIKNQKGTPLCLGIDAHGLNVYEKDHKLNPKISFPWNETKHISFHDKRFEIKCVDKKSPDFVFKTDNLSTSTVILELCIGNHELYKRRRKPDTMEIQQMKALAKEEKLRRQIERNKLLKERQAREEAVKQKEELEKKLLEYQEDAKKTREALMQAEEMAELLAEKARVAEEEAALLQMKATDAEEELQKLRATAMKTVDDKMAMQRKAKETEKLMGHVVQESETRAREAAVRRLLEMSTSATTLPTSNAASWRTDSFQSKSVGQLVSDGEMSSAYGEYEQERYDFITRNKSAQLQLQPGDLRTELEELKPSDRHYLWDSIHNEQSRGADNKYSTLQKISSGTSKARIEFFEEL
ncbi:merlin-like isoform X2 [Actinia tenebrosa]|uniref:Merlin-like isoform X2 n=1 Tax=Actinia tenebrosa TaxID=6105 RepID=A0A6P8HSR8_ACTTE|nr:merlin-like isoform X2 [Actinia tenebrosa]